MTNELEELYKIDNELFRLTGSYWLAPRFMAFEYIRRRRDKVDAEISNEELIKILQSYK